MTRISALANIALVVVALSSRSAVAQQRLVVGTVTAIDGTPLVEATLAIRRYRLVAQSGRDGRYEIVIPDSIARGAIAPLEVRLIGHAMQSVPIVLDGPMIVRDFVLQIDTVDHHPGMRFGGGTVTTDLRISGKIADSSGAGIPYASVTLSGMAISEQTDEDGNYKLTIPATKVTGKVAPLQIREMEYAFVGDTVTLVGSEIRRDFTMFKRIYSERAKPLDRKTLQSFALADLRGGPHRMGEREIRIRMDIGYFSSTLFRLVNNSGKTTGEMLSFIPPWSHQDPIPHPPRHHSDLRACINGSDFILPCRVAMTRAPDWGRLWNSLDSLDIWNIVDEGSLRKRQTIIMDGSQITAEMWDGRSYKAWSYASGVEDDGPGRAKVTVVSHLLRELNDYAAP